MSTRHLVLIAAVCFVASFLLSFFATSVLLAVTK